MFFENKIIFYLYSIKQNFVRLFNKLIKYHCKNKFRKLVCWLFCLSEKEVSKRCNTHKFWLKHFTSGVSFLPFARWRWTKNRLTEIRREWNCGEEGRGQLEIIWWNGKWWITCQPMGEQHLLYRMTFFKRTINQTNMVFIENRISVYM